MYNRQIINGLDPRQMVYLNYHTDGYGTEQLIINGENYYDRIKKVKPSPDIIQEGLKGYEDYEAYLDCNARGWSLVFRTEKNENMYNWDKLEKVN